MRVIVLGAPASGKSRFAAELAGRTGLPHLEADRWFWSSGGLAALESELAADAWILEGHDGKLRARSWPRATHFVWLDPPGVVLLARVLGRAGRGSWRKLVGDLRRLASARTEFAGLARPEWIRVRGAAARMTALDQLAGGGAGDLRRT